MDSFEVNKIIGALLGVVFVIFSVSLISDAIFASPEPEKPGYAIEAAEGAGEAGGGGAKKDEVEDIKPMLASADADKGKAIFKRCAACHTDDQSGANKVGPNLWGVVDRPIASHEGFSYSAAMKEFSQGGKEHWTYDHLNNFLHSPKKVVPGTAMGFAGLPKAEDRANVIAYLRTQSDNPAPLPSPEEAAKEGDKGGAEAAEGGEKAGAEADKAGEAAEGGDAAKAPAEGAAETDKSEGAAAGGDQQDKAPAADADKGDAAGTEQQDGKEGEQAQPSDEKAPAAESSTTESGTSGSGQRAEPDASNQDEPNADTPTTDSDAVERKQGEGSGSAQ